MWVSLTHYGSDSLSVSLWFVNKSSSHCRVLWAIPFKLSQFLSQFLSHWRVFWAYLPFIVVVFEPICFQLSRFWASLPLIVAACELSLTHSGSLWLFLVVASSLWFPLALTGSLPVSLWLSMALCDSRSGSHCRWSKLSPGLGRFFTFVKITSCFTVIYPFPEFPLWRPGGIS